MTNQNQTEYVIWMAERAVNIAFDVTDNIDVQIEENDAENDTIATIILKGDIPAYGAMSLIKQLDIDERVGFLGLSKINEEIRIHINPA